MNPILTFPLWLFPSRQALESSSERAMISSPELKTSEGEKDWFGICSFSIRIGLTALIVNWSKLDIFNLGNFEIRNKFYFT